MTKLRFLFLSCRWLNSILSIISAEKLNKMNKSVDMVRLLEKYDALLFPWTCHKPSLESPQKSNSKSNLYRNQGNEQYVQKHYVKALDLFNQSICWAPSASEQLSKGYANRSVVYSSLKMYEKCLKRNKSASNKFSTAKDAILIYKFLLSTTAFKKIFKNHEQIDFLIDLISRLLRIASLNTFNVQSVGNFFSERRSEDGQYSCGIYLLMSLMNHSCAPNTYHVRYGFDNTVIVAKPIKAGEQLFVSYKLSNFSF